MHAQCTACVPSRRPHRPANRRGTGGSQASSGGHVLEGAPRAGVDALGHRLDLRTGFASDAVSAGMRLGHRHGTECWHLVGDSREPSSDPAQIQLRSSSDPAERRSHLRARLRSWHAGPSACSSRAPFTCWPGPSSYSWFLPVATCNREAGERTALSQLQLSAWKTGHAAAGGGPRQVNGSMHGTLPVHRLRQL